MHGMNRRGGFAVVTGAAMALLMTAPGRAQDDARALTDAYNAGGSALFKQVSAAPGNIVLSPLSVGTAMAMALSGARGETEREMASVLAQRLDRSAMAAANGALLTALKLYDKSAARCPQGMQVTMPAGGAERRRCEGALRPDGRCAFPAVREGERCVAAGSPQPSARLLTANALMLAGRGDLVARDYAALLKDKFGAEIFRDAGLDDVNAWVKRKTEGKIERILEHARSLGRGRHSQRRLFQGQVGRGLRQGRHHGRGLQSVAAEEDFGADDAAQRQLRAGRAAALSGPSSAL